MPPIRVLIVDDDEADYRITAGMLGAQDLTAFEVERAPTYEAGAAALREREHDVYLIDHRLGARTGLELIREGLEEGGPAAVLVLTGYDDHEVDREASELGATEFLLKNRLSPELLERSIRYALRHHEVLDELRSSQRELNAARLVAEDASRAKDEFLSRVSHELRTPLTAILGYSQLLDLEELGPSQRECVAEIAKGGKHLLELIDEILDLSRVEAGTIAVSAEPVYATAVVADALAMIKPLAQEAGVRLQADPRDLASAYVLADDQRLRQVLLNLLSNAVKYNDEGGSVSVSFRTGVEGRLGIEIADEGRGMSPEQLKKLFTPFDRLGLERSEIEGTGLGMALSLRLIEAMGGTMEVRSELGIGTTVAIELARVTGEPSASGSSEAPERGRDRPLFGPMSDDFVRTARLGRED